MVEIVVFERGWVTFSANFRGNGASPTNGCWRQKIGVPGLLCGIVCMILGLAILVEHTMTASTALA